MHLCREFLIDREIVVIGHRLFVVMRVKGIDRKWAENRIPCCPRKAITTGNIGRARSMIRRRILNLIVRAAQVRRHREALRSIGSRQRAGRVVIGIVESVCSPATTEYGFAIAVEVVCQPCARLKKTKVDGAPDKGTLGLV